MRASRYEARTWSSKARRFDVRQAGATVSEFRIGDGR